MWTTNEQLPEGWIIPTKKWKINRALPNSWKEKWKTNGQLPEGWIICAKSGKSIESFIMVGKKSGKLMGSFLKVG